MEIIACKIFFFPVEHGVFIIDSMACSILMSLDFNLIWLLLFVLLFSLVCVIMASMSFNIG